LMCFGQSEFGKTYSMLGDVKYTRYDSVEIQDIGMHLQGMIQLFKVSKQRQDRYNDKFTLSIIEVMDEKLCDLIAGTPYGDAWGVIGDKKVEIVEKKSLKSSKRNDDEAFSQLSSKSRKLEIRNSNDGEIIIQGVLSVQVSNYDDVVELWKQVLHRRWKRIQDQGSDLASHNAASHVIATLRIVSTNIATGVGTQGKIQFVDFASSNLIPLSNCVKSKSTKGNGDILSPVGNNYDWKYVNKSVSVFSEVIIARSQFARDVPYRNSTITHLLQDSLEADTKVMMLLCVSANPNDIQQTASALKLAAKVRKVVIGKATKHAKQG
jgi:kinesin family member C2/C3